MATCKCANHHVGNRPSHRAASTLAVDVSAFRGRYRQLFVHEYVLP
jgi:hypothetical protein